MKSSVKVTDLKPGAIIVTTMPVTSAEDMWVLLYPRARVTHAMIYTPAPGRVNVLTHAVAARDLHKDKTVKSHSFYFQFSRESHEEVHVFNPKDTALGKAAAEQVVRWQSFGLNYDVRKFNQGKSFEKLANVADSIFTEFDPAELVKLVYRRFLPKARMQANRELESGVTCHGLVIDAYNTAWLAGELSSMGIDISPKRGEKYEYVTVKYASTAAASKSKRPYYFPVDHCGIPGITQKQKEKYAGDADFKTHPRGKHPLELIDEKKREAVIKKCKVCPFPFNTKLTTVANLFAHLKESSAFTYLGLLDKKSLKPLSDEKARAMREVEALQATIATERQALIELEQNSVISGAGVQVVPKAVSIVTVVPTTSAMPTTTPTPTPTPTPHGPLSLAMSATPATSVDHTGRIRNPGKF